MTVEEALETLRYEIEEEGHCSYIEDEMKVAFEALEKQIPKKPIKKNPICYQRTKDGGEKYAYDFHCALCDTKINKEKHHCPCGQAIDWSDAE